MGSDQHHADERPRFDCELIQSPYFLAAHPVTVAQYALFIQEGGYRDESYWTTEAARDWLRETTRRMGRRLGPRDFDAIFQTPNRPRVGVSWFEAQAYCAWLNRTRRQLLRLPDGSLHPSGPPPYVGGYAAFANPFP